MLRLAVSPCSNPRMGLQQALAAYRAIGYTKFEAFCEGLRSALHWRTDPAECRRLFGRYGMQLCSYHLPVIGEPWRAGLRRAIQAARFAAAAGARVVLFKAATLDLYARAAGPFLDAVEGLPITPVLQNHAGKAISTLDDMLAALGRIADRRMKVLLEVGQYHTVGVHWRTAADALADRIALVHLKDQVGPRSVPFGKGEIDLPGVFRHLEGLGYRGEYVIEMEPPDRWRSPDYLAMARDYVLRYCLKG